MSVSIGIVRSFNDGVSNLGTASVTITDGGNAALSTALPTTGTTNQHFTIALAYTSLQAFCALAQTNNATIKINTTSGTAQSIALTAGVPFVWANDGYFSNPFTADVSALYLTAPTGPVQLDIRAVVHPV